MMKLSGSQEISKIVLKMSEIRRSKTVKQLNLYYSNKIVPSAVELKNKYIICLLYYIAFCKLLKFIKFFIQ